MNYREIEKELSYRRIKNVVTVDDEISIVDPITGELMSIFDTGYPIKIKTKNGRLMIYGKYDPIGIESGSGVVKKMSGSKYKNE